MLMFNKGQIFSLAGKRNAGGKNVGLVLNIHTAISAEADMKNVAKTNRLGIGQVEHASATLLSPCCKPDIVLIFMICRWRLFFLNIQNFLSLSFYCPYSLVDWKNRDGGIWC